MEDTKRERTVSRPLPLRPQDELECRRCDVHCDKVVYPSACVERACPFLYAYEDHGHTWFIWTCAAGTGGGLLGLWYVQARERAIQREKQDSGRSGKSGKSENSATSGNSENSENSENSG